MPPTLTGFEGVCLPGPAVVDLPRNRWVDEGDIMPEEEEEDVEMGEDIRFPSPSPMLGLFAELRDAFRPREAKNPPEGVEMDVIDLLGSGETGMAWCTAVGD